MNNRDDPWVYRPGIYVRNMQRDGMCVLSNVLVLVTSTDDFDGSNDKATFYTDTMESSYMRGRRSIVPSVPLPNLIRPLLIRHLPAAPTFSAVEAGKVPSIVFSSSSSSPLIPFSVSTSRCTQELRHPTGVSILLALRLHFILTVQSPADDFKTEGWTYEDLLPLMKRVNIPPLTSIPSTLMF